MQSFKVSKQYLCYLSTVHLQRFSTISRVQSSFLKQHQILHSPLLTFRKISFNIFNIEAIIKVQSPLKLKFWDRSKKSDQKIHNKDIYLLKDDFKFHHKVPRDTLVGNLSKTIQGIGNEKTKVVYVYGLPGIGKKGLVRQFAEEHYKSLSKKVPKTFVAMINAANPNSFHQDLFEIAEKIGVIENFEEYSKTTSKIEGYKEILSKISTHLKDRPDWLLIVQDIKLDRDLKWRIGGPLPGKTDLPLVNKMQTMDISDGLPLPGNPNNGTILLTTCDSYAHRHCSMYTDCFKMPKGMEVVEAVQLLEHASGFKDLRRCSPALRVMQELNNVPTSVYCAGLHVSARASAAGINDPNVLFGNLLKDIQSPKFSNITKMASDERIDDLDYPLKMRKMQKVAVEDLTKTDSLRKKVYTLLACCAPSAIPPQLITSITGKWPENDVFVEKQIYGSETSRVNIPAYVRNYLSWVTTLFGGYNTKSAKLLHYEVIQVTQGFHDIFRELFISGKYDLYHDLKQFSKCLISYYEENGRISDVHTITTRKLLLPHIQSFIQLIETNERTKKLFEVEIADLYLCLGISYTLEGELSKPRECFKKAHQLYKSQENTLKQVKAYIELGKAQSDVSENLADSMSYLEKAEELLNSYDNQNDDEARWYRFQILHYKGDTNSSLGKFSESRSCFMQCLAVLHNMQRTDETKHFIFMIHLKLCGVIRKIGDDHQCRKYIEKAEEMIPDLNENENYSILQAELKHQKAIILRDQCLPQESINLLKEAHDIFKTVYGKDHVKVALIESELSVSLRHNNDLLESKEMALSAMKKLTQGELYHSEKAKVLSNLGSTYTHLCDFDRAQKFLERALAIAEDDFEANIDTWTIKKTDILEKMGTMKRRQGNVHESFELLSQCVYLKSKHYSHYSHPHPDLAQALVTLGKTQHRMCLLPDSLHSLHKALKINESHFGRNYPQPIFVDALIAKVLRDAGNADLSLTMINEAIARHEGQMNKEELNDHLKIHPQYAAMHATKGMLQMDDFIEDPTKQNYGNKAETTLLKALNLHEHQNAPSFLQQIEILCHLARVYCTMKEYKTATKTFQKANELVSKSIGRNHPLFATVLASWSRVYYDQGDVSKAISMLEEAWRIRDGFLRSELHPNPLLYAYFLAKYCKEIDNNEKALHWCDVAINGYAYLISKEEVRVRDLKVPHVILKYDQLPVCEFWRKRLDYCRESYKELMDL